MSVLTPKPCRYGALVGAVGAVNVSIVGGGTIDGQGSLYFWPSFDLKDKGSCFEQPTLRFVYFPESSSRRIEVLTYISVWGRWGGGDCCSDVKVH
jgi:hypothetical protein